MCVSILTNWDEGPDAPLALSVICIHFMHGWKLQPHESGSILLPLGTGANDYMRCKAATVTSTDKTAERPIIFKTPNHMEVQILV